MAENSTDAAFSAGSTELDSFVERNPSTAATQGDSDLQDVGMENPRCNSQRLIVGVILFLGIICLIVGIVLISLAKEKRDCDLRSNGTEQLDGTASPTKSDVCQPSAEALKTSLYAFLQKVQDQAFALNPQILLFKPGIKKDEIRRDYKPYDPTPSEIKRRTDEAWRLLAEINEKKIDEPKLKPSERKAISQVKFYLRHVFGNPYEGNYYAADWMLGPNFFCWQPICSLKDEISDALPYFAPVNVSDMEVLRKIMQAYKTMIDQYIDNIKLGVRSGMVGSVEECRAGLDTLKDSFGEIQVNVTDVLKEKFVAKLLEPEFYANLTKEMKEGWLNRTGETVLDSVKKYLVDYVGAPINKLLSYLETDHMRHCVPSNISSGLANRPLNFVYVDGKPDKSQPTVRNLSNGDVITGPKSYASILSFFTTTDITPDEVYNKGWEMINKTYPQIISLAKKITGKSDTEAAVKEFKQRMSSQDMYFNDEPLPANETGSTAFKLCNSIEGAVKFCPKRWEAIQKWFKAAREAMSFLEPKTRNMFYFTGSHQTTPSCPVQLYPDFNPSSAAQSYRNSDFECSMNCRYHIPFFLDNMGPIFGEWSVNAHEARPGHHTQAQGFVEHFTDKCGGVISWINQAIDSVAFAEGWGLYAEMLIAEDTDSYKDHLWKRYGALKWRLWRALRLVLDVGLHSKGLSRREGLDLVAKYAWDTSDIAQKEMTRYQSGPGQASAYMIGQLIIERLRKDAEIKLKQDFDLREFHYQILNQGSAPMSFIESHIKQFVACKLDPKTPGCKLILNPANLDEVILQQSNANKLLSEYHKIYYPRRHYV